MNGEKAFPIITPDGVDWNQGMTMRQYYKAAALQGILSCPGNQQMQKLLDSCGKPGGQAISIYAGKIADAMLAEDASKDGEVGK